MRELPLKTLQRLFDEAYRSELSSFYREVYRRRGFAPDDGFPATEGEWHSAPLIRKEDLAKYRFDQRAFQPPDEPCWMHMSSGTSRRPVVINLRNRQHVWGDISGMASRLMYFRAPFGYAAAAQMGIEAIAGDLSDMSGTVQLAARFHIDALETSVSQLSSLTEPLSQAMDLSLLRLIMLNGERFSKAGYEFVRHRYRNALVLPVYGSAETHGIHARACTELGKTGRNVVHFLEDTVYPEIVEETGAPLGADAEGELVLTVLWERNIFPVIRFGTGDIARRVERLCACGRDTYEILGRVEFDRLLIPGGMLKSEELERVLEPYADSIRDDFELHVSDDAGEPRIKTNFELRVRTKKKTDLKALAADVADRMHVGPAQTVRSGIERGLYAGFTCVEVPESKVPGKPRRILRDDSAPDGV